MRGAQSLLLRFVMHTSLICELRKILIDGKLEQKAKVQREGKPLGWSEIIPLSMKELFRGRQAWDRPYKMKETIKLYKS